MFSMLFEKNLTHWNFETVMFYFVQWHQVLHSPGEKQVHFHNVLQVLYFWALILCLIY